MAIFGGLSVRFFSCLLASIIGPLLFGYHLAELNAPEAVIRCTATSNMSPEGLRPCIPMTPEDFGTVTAAFSVGGLIGALSSGYLASKLGRKGTMLLIDIGFIGGPAIMTFAESMWVLSLGRIVSGVAAGSAIVVVPLYVNEISPLAFRGLFGACVQVFVNVGILIAQVLGLFMSSQKMWRVILAIGGLIGLLQACTLPWAAVESPRWLAQKAKNKAESEHALSVLQSLRGHGGAVQEEISVFPKGGYTEVSTGSRPASPNRMNSSEPLLGIVEPMSVAGEHKSVGMWEFIWESGEGGRYRRVLLVVVGVMLAQQLTGINAVVMYGVSILHDVFPTSAPLINVIISAVNVIVTIFAATMVDKAGRKSLLLGSITGMGVCSALVGVGILARIPMLSAVATLLFVASFAMGLGPIPFMAASETAYPDFVESAQAIGLATNWTGTFLVSFLYPIISHSIGSGKTFLIFTFLSGVFFAWVWFLVPETKGKSPQEAWESWNGESPCGGAGYALVHERED